jgi:hemerythrin-like domain-containing protein
MTTEHGDGERRQFLQALASGAALALAGCATTGSGRPAPKAAGSEDEGVSPGEDLMREHGVLERVLLIYEECARRLDGSAPAPLDVLSRSAGIIRRFVEDYHERLEEQHLFPRFEAARQELELVRTLRDQHARGRELTDRIMQLVTAGGSATSPERGALSQVLRSFSRMYRPHAAREDTVLFPAFARLVGGHAYHELGEQFEEREHALFGEHGFDDVVREVASIEQTLGIYDLALFTASGKE